MPAFPPAPTSIVRNRGMMTWLDMSPSYDSNISWDSDWSKSSDTRTAVLFHTTDAIPLVEMLVKLSDRLRSLAALPLLR